jgi:hypothetical protein
MRNRLARLTVIFYPSNIDFFSSIKYKCLQKEPQHKYGVTQNYGIFKVDICY